MTGALLITIFCCSVNYVHIKIGRLHFDHSWMAVVCFFCWFCFRMRRGGGGGKDGQGHDGDRMSRRRGE